MVGFSICNAIFIFYFLISPYHYLKIINDHFGLFMLYVSQGIKTHYPETISLNDLNLNAFMSNLCLLKMGLFR